MGGIKLKKKLFGVLCVLTLVFGLTACGKKKEENNTLENSNQENNGVVLGGWNTNLDTKLVVSEEELKIFNKATLEYDGMEFEPIALLATQVVAGKNYAILCLQKLVLAEPIYKISLVTIYEDLDKNAEILGIENIDLGEYIR